MREVPRRIAATDTQVCLWPSITTATQTVADVAEQLSLVVAALAGCDNVILFVESLEVPPTKADMLHELAEHVQIAATL